MFEDAWQSVEIGQCLSSSFSGEWGTDTSPSNARVLRATDIDNAGRIVTAGASRYIPQQKLTDKSLRRGDILLEGSGGSPDQPVGRVAYFDGLEPAQKYLCSNFFRTLRVDHRVANSRFLFWKLMWFYHQPEIRNLQQQTTGIINLKFGGYKEAKIYIPVEVAEQAKIAEVLDTIDSKIEGLWASIRKLKEVKLGLRHDLLTRGIDSNGELRLPPQEARDLYKDSAVGWIPKEWNVRPLGGAADTLIDGPFGSKLKTEHYAQDGVRVVRLQNIHLGNYDDSERAFISSKYAASLDRNRVEGGDVLIASLGDDNYPVGRACIYPLDLPSAVNKADCFRFRGKLGVVNAFIMLFMNGELARAQARRYEQGVTMKRINLGNLRQILVSLPDENEQRLIASRMESVDTEIGLAKKELDKRLMQKTGLMDDLLTGRVRVTSLLNK